MNAHDRNELRYLRDASLIKIGLQKEFNCVSVGMDTRAKGVDCGVTECVKHGALRWFRMVLRIHEDDFMKLLSV